MPTKWVTQQRKCERRPHGTALTCYLSASCGIHARARHWPQYSTPNTYHQLYRHRLSVACCTAPAALSPTHLPSRRLAIAPVFSTSVASVLTNAITACPISDRYNTTSAKSDIRRVSTFQELRRSAGSLCACEDTRRQRTYSAESSTRAVHFSNIHVRNHKVTLTA